MCFVWAIDHHTVDKVASFGYSGENPLDRPLISIRCVRRTGLLYGASKVCCGQQAFISDQLHHRKALREAHVRQCRERRRVSLRSICEHGGGDEVDHVMVNIVFRRLRRRRLLDFSFQLNLWRKLALLFLLPPTAPE